MRLKRWHLLVALVGIGSLLTTMMTLFWRQQNQRAAASDPISDAAARYGIPSSLVKAIIWKESGFDPDARGASGEIGLMQIRKLAAQEWAAAESIKDFKHAHVANPTTNTLAGTWYLKKLLQRYRHTDNPLPYALADYNAGRRNVLRWLDGAAKTNSAAFMTEIDFPGTRAYIKAVINRFQEYRNP